MTANNPPPLRIPEVFSSDPITFAFFRGLVGHLFYQWERLGGGTGVLPIAGGGTGANTAEDARDNLGLEIGVDILAYDVGLQAIADLVTGIDTGIYTTSEDVWVTFTLTSAGRALLDDATAADQRATLGLSATDAVTFDDLTITGDLNHDGTGVGFYGTAPTTKGAAITADEIAITHTAPSVADYAIADFSDGNPLLLTDAVPAVYGFVSKDEANTVLQVIANLQARVSDLESRIQAVGLIS